ncbi:MAG: hypothetical protein ACKVOR_00895 [Flavobacteriales bacterium]
MQDRLKMIEHMLVTNPDDCFLLYCAALELHKKGEIVAAIKSIRHIVKQDPDYLPSYYQLGKWLEECGKQDEAIIAYKAGRSVAKKRNDIKTLGELSEALMLLDVYEE